MTEYVFKFPVEPVAQMRPRFTLLPYVHAYDHLQAKRLLWYQNDGGMNQ